MQWLSKLLGRKPKDLPHPPGPVVNPITGMPKPHFEYFVEPLGDIFQFKLRLYLPLKNEDGTWTTVPTEVNSPANSEATARATAQRMGHAAIAEVKAKYGVTP